MSIEKAFRLPLVEGNLVKVVIGALLSLIPIVNFLASGFVLEAMGNAARGKTEMPVWEDWGGKFVKGLVALVISVLYMAVPLILLLIGINSGAMVGLSCLVALVVWFVLPMALASYAATGSFGAAFAVGAVLSKIGGALGAYLGAYLFSVLLMIGLGILMAIPIVGWIVAILGGFYAGCVLSFLFGNAYYRATKPADGQQVELN